MTSIYNLRTYCPNCGVVIKPEKVRSHLLKSHKELPEDIIATYEAFINKCIESNVGERISIDLSDFSVTLLDRPSAPTIQKGYRASLCKTSAAVSQSKKVTVTRKRLDSNEKNDIYLGRRVSGQAVGAAVKSMSLVDKLNCPFCHGVGGLESSHGCFYCGA